MKGTSKEYAVALFRLAAENGCETEVQQGLELIRQVVRQTPDFMGFLKSPAISKQTRLDTVRASFGNSIPEYAVSFLCLLCENGCPDILEDCISDYGSLYRESRHTCRVTVTSAVELTEDEKTSLCAKLAHKLQKTPLMRYRTDPALLGGLTVETDGLLLDGSLRHRLTAIKEVMDQ